MAKIIQWDASVEPLCPVQNYCMFSTTFLCFQFVCWFTGGFPGPVPGPTFGPVRGVPPSPVLGSVCPEGVVPLDTTRGYLPLPCLSPQIGQGIDQGSPGHEKG